MDPVNNLTNNFASGIALNDTDSRVLSENRNSSPSSNFKWKLDAPEFVPRLANTAVTPVAGSSNSNIYNNEPTATSNSNNLDFEAEMANAMNMVDYIVAELQERPETSDALSAQFLHFLNQNVLSKKVATSVFSRLLDAALSIENFAYVCVRLMVFLYDNYEREDSSDTKSQLDSQESSKDDTKNSFVRHCLLDCLEAEFEQRKLALESKNEEETPRLMVFVHSLCMFSTAISMKGRPLRPLVIAVYDLHELVAKQRTDVFVKFAVQSLKTVGAHLESAEKLYDADKTPRLDGLIDLLECIGTEADSKLSDNTKFMIRNLRGVRRHWAYVAPSPAPTPAATAYYDDQLQVNSTKFI